MLKLLFLGFFLFKKENDFVKDANDANLDAEE